MAESDAVTAANRQTAGSPRARGAVTEVQPPMEGAREGGESTEAMGDANRRKLLNYAL